MIGKILFKTEYGLMAFDRDGKLLTDFKTWRNSDTEEAATELTEKFNFNIPLRWTIAHVYQAILEKAWKEQRSFIRKKIGR